MCGHTLQATHLCVFVHTTVLPFIARPSLCHAAVATGLGSGDQRLGNKGGIGIGFRVGQTSMLFVNAHLEAHMKRNDARNKQYHKITADLVRQFAPKLLAAGAAAPPLPAGDGAAASAAAVAAVDRIFWAGDVNYRVDLPRDATEAMIAAADVDGLRAADQMRTAHGRGDAFGGLVEGPLNFKPTYKFDKGSDVYDSSKKQRVPAWTDRVYYKHADGLEVVAYNAETSIRTSDHRPVYAAFRVPVAVTADDGRGGDLPLDVEGSQVCAIS